MKRNLETLTAIVCAILLVGFLVLYFGYCARYLFTPSYIVPLICRR